MKRVLWTLVLIVGAAQRGFPESKPPAPSSPVVVVIMPGPHICRATKIADRKFLTASHCVASERGYHPGFRPGDKVSLLSVTGQELCEGTVVKARAHDSMLELMARLGRSDSDLATEYDGIDLGIFELAQDTPAIARFSVRTEPVPDDANLISVSHVFRTRLGGEDQFRPKLVTGTIESRTPTMLISGQFSLTHGDSGAPLLYEEGPGRFTVAAVAHGVKFNVLALLGADSESRFTRLDNPSAAAWLRSALAEQ